MLERARQTLTKVSESHRAAARCARLRGAGRTFLSHRQRSRARRSATSICGTPHDLSERFFSGKTRALHATHVTTGDRLWSTLPFLRPLATITHDTLGWYGFDADGGGVHDVIGTRCDPYTNRLLSGGDYHHCCHSNLTRALAAARGMDVREAELQVHDVLNVFMCTGFTRDTHQYFMKASPVRPGDFIEFFAEIDLLGALSACPGGDCGAEHSSDTARLLSAQGGSVQAGGRQPDRLAPPAARAPIRARTGCDARPARPIEFINHTGSTLAVRSTIRQPRMPASETSSSAPNFTERNALIDRVEGAVAIAARRQTFRAAVDHSLQELRDECARTMALIRHLRTSPLYDRASATPRFEAGLVARDHHRDEPR